MRDSAYQNRDYAFGQSMLVWRTRLNLTQAGLAEILGVSRRAVSDWETGGSYPKVEHLRQIITLALGRRIVTRGQESEEIHAFWQASHQKVPLDEMWLSQILPVDENIPINANGITEPVSNDATTQQQIDLGNVFAIQSFYGRVGELNILSDWVITEHCQVVTIVGLGGIGKSTLAVSLMHRVAENFSAVIWRSLRDIPSSEVLFEDLIQVLAPRALGQLSARLEERQNVLINVLLEQMRGTPVLLVLDNFDAVLEAGESTGRLRSGYEGIGRFLHLCAETSHKGCVVLTSREKPENLQAEEGSHSPVRTLRLSRLDANSCERLLIDKGLSGAESDRADLIEAYAGNPLALKIVAQTIVDLFGSEIKPFLEQGKVIFGGIRDLLGVQYARLSNLEQSLLLWLAVLREPATLDTLALIRVDSISRVRMLEAIEALRRRSLIEPGQKAGSFTLQPVVLEYITDQLITEAVDEIYTGDMELCIAYGFELAQVSEYVRQNQNRLIISPILSNLRKIFPQEDSLQQHLRELLSKFTQSSESAQGYGPANLLALLLEASGHLRGLDLAKLAIRGAYLQGAEMQESSLAGGLLHDTVFTGSFDTVWAIAISRSARYWAAGSGQGKVQIWTKEGKRLHLAWQAHSGTIWSLAFSPDENRLATASWDGSIKLWDLSSGTLLWTNWHTNNDIHCLAFTANGRMLASGGDDGTVRIWDVGSGKCLQTLAGHHSPVHSLAWNFNGSLLASGGFDGGIRVWERPWERSTPPVRVLAAHPHWVTGLAFAPDGGTLASSSFDGTLKLWEVESLRLRETLVGHTGPVLSIAWCPDGNSLASSSFDRTIWLWDTNPLRSRMVLRGHSAAVYNIAFTPDSHNLLSSSDDGTLRYWEVERGQCVRILQGYAPALFDVCWSPDGSQLASAGSDTLITTWKLTESQLARELQGHFWIVPGVDWNPDGRLLASAAWDNTVRIWDAATGTALQTLHQPDHPDTGFQCVAWSPDGKLLASGSYLWGVHVWDVHNGDLRWIGHEQATRIRRVAWSPDGTLLASCGDDGSVCLWDPVDGRLWASLKGHRGMVMSVAWSTDGTCLASGGGSKGSGEVIIWDIPGGEILQTWSEPGMFVYTLTWSPDGRQLITGSSDGMLRWWDVQAETSLQVQLAHQGAVQSIRKSPDGSLLASCGDDGAIMLWDLNTGTHIQTLRRDRPYERLDITGLHGLSAVQKANLIALGAFEREQRSD